jgi:uncharacterized protein YoxC
MFETSRDVLNWILSISILGLAVFICWFMYYLVASLRAVYKMIAEVQDMLEKVSNLSNLIKEKIEEGAATFGNLNNKLTELIETVKEKLSHSSSYLMIIGEVLKKIFDFIQMGKEKRARKID